ncbi:MAG: hypothetical protein K8S56_01090, partial [Candidatus Cloacimonetes bacterium]|nr:hypothetical protein [Candidatus Cloacimonadota bacterium]
RAARGLFMSYTIIRRIMNSNDYVQPSRFIEEMSEKKQYWNRNSFMVSKSKGRKSVVQHRSVVKRKNVVLESEKFYQIGDRISHETLGIGTILSVDGSGASAKLAVSFDNGQLKRIVGSYVKPVTT